MTPTRLRQIALVAGDLKRAKHLLTTILGSEVIYEDPQVAQWGLENFLVAIGGDVIEVVSPLRPGTTAGRLLAKRGDGGYMIIMQTIDAAKQRESIESRGLAKVIWKHEHDDAVAVQYHPKGIKGGMMPELDSHSPTPNNPTPIGSRFSPWHACGSDYGAYAAGMKRCSDLQLMGATLRLAPGDSDSEAAARQWNDYFDIPSAGSELYFTNARLSFVPETKGKLEGLDSITLAVQGEERMNEILNRANKEGLCGDGWINMVGVRWFLVQAEDIKPRL